MPNQWNVNSQQLRPDLISNLVSCPACWKTFNQPATASKIIKQLFPECSYRLGLSRRYCRSPPTLFMLIKKPIHLFLLCWLNRKKSKMSMDRGIEEAECSNHASGMPGLKHIMGQSEEKVEDSDMESVDRSYHNFSSQQDSSNVLCNLLWKDWLMCPNGTGEVTDSQWAILCRKNRTIWLLSLEAAITLQGSCSRLSQDESLFYIPILLH